MTYGERYSELYKNVEEAGKALETSLQKISDINGFGDMNDLGNYFQAQNKFAYHSRQFDTLLKYINNGKVDPNSEYMDKEFMYEFIKSDQQKIGTDWDEADLYPGQSKEGRFYS
ncbi:MAG: hypothetical protein J7497_06870, partial [Chitinophagaceae bacterium]|nr:hypothetical protein [Chitinophagaceae bacterium]